MQALARFDVYGGSPRAIFDYAFYDQGFEMKTGALAKMSWATIAAADAAHLALNDEVNSTLLTILVPYWQQGAYTLLWACTFYFFLRSALSNLRLW